MAAVMARAKRKVTKKYIRVGVGFASEHPFRARLRGNTGNPDSKEADGKLKPVVNLESGHPQTFLPSETWVDLHFPEHADVDADGKPIVVRYYQRGAKASPLNSGATAMVRCSCGRLTPPIAFEGGTCMDCRSPREHSQYGPSPSGKAISELEMRNLRLEQVKLKPEDKSSLINEINRVVKYKWKPIG